jgi:hypothetical protein
MSAPDSTTLIRFYLGEKTDTRGRSIEQIWRFTDLELEGLHDYIQWLFPLTEPSRFNASAPVLDKDAVTTFRNSQTLKDRLRKSLEIMLRFYSLQLTIMVDGTVAVERMKDFEYRRTIWLRPENHNHLRLTRILSSLSLLGLEALALALFSALRQICRDYPGQISADSFAYWCEAVPNSGGAEPRASE